MYIDNFKHGKFLEPYPDYFIEISLNAISINPQYKTDPNLFLILDYFNSISKRHNADIYEQILNMKYSRYGISGERIRSI